MSGSGREAIPDVRVRSGGPPGCMGVVGRPFRMSGSGWEASLMSGSGRGHSWMCGVVRRPSRMSGSVRETLLDVREVIPDVREW